MHYDPIKDRLGRYFSKRPLLQRLFFVLLQAIFLRNWYVRRTIKALFRERPLETMLDAGTGFGQHTYFVLKSFPQVQILAVDVKQDYLDKAQRFMDQTPYGSRVRWAWADLTQFESDARFDFILSVDVMEHIEDDRGVFRNFARVLRPGGYVLINTPSDQGGSGVMEDGDERFIGEHVRDGYNPDELGAKLVDAGLEVDHYRYSYGPYGSAGWHLLVKWPMQLLSASWVLLVLLPFYYLLAFPLGMVLNTLDVRRANASGTGLMMVARRPVSPDGDAE